MAKRKIPVVTTTRADYGLLRQLLLKLEADPNVELFLYVSGTHLLPEFGLTINDIKDDHLPIRAELKVPITGQDNHSMAVTSSELLEKVASQLDTDQPDMIVVLGDRYEMLAVAQAAFLMQIPIAHIHGGEVTYGAIDDSIRHAISKLSHMHFTTTEDYKDRVLQLGEDDKQVHFVGAPGIDNIRLMDYMEREELEKDLDVKLDRPILLITYHPETALTGDKRSDIQPMLEALSSMGEFTLIFTSPNADAGGRDIKEQLDKFIKQNDNAYFFHSLGYKRYLSLMKISSVTVGNSSSGIIESPYLGVPTVNIGDRQEGRVRATSVVDCANDKEQIVNAIKKCGSKKFLDQVKDQFCPYGFGDSASKMHKYLTEVDLEGLYYKRFVDRR